MLDEPYLWLTECLLLSLKSQVETLKPVEDNPNGLAPKSWEPKHSLLLCSLLCNFGIAFRIFRFGVHFWNKTCISCYCHIFTFMLILILLFYSILHRSVGSPVKVILCPFKKLFGFYLTLLLLFRLYWIECELAHFKTYYLYYFKIIN